ncbi:MAG: hypothetical protein ACYC6C_14700 [Coriobacteriia bacterium]
MDTNATLTALSEIDVDALRHRLAELHEEDRRIRLLIRTARQARAQLGNPATANAQRQEAATHA